MFITRISPLVAFSTGETPGGGEGPAPETAPETTPADTPAEGTGTDDQQPQAAQVNWEDRYKEAQAWGTRNAQELAEARTKAQLVDAWNSGDPAQQAWAAEQLRIQLQEDDDEVDVDDTLTPPPAGLSDEDRQLLDAVRQERTQQQEQSQQAAQYNEYRSVVDPELDRLGIDKSFHDDVAEVALTLPPVQTPQGPQPDLAGAVKHVEELALRLAGLPGVRPKLFDQLRKTKQAPTVASGGAGTQVPSLDTSQNRVKYMLDLAAQRDG